VGDWLGNRWFYPEADAVDPYCFSKPFCPARLILFHWADVSGHGTL
jgi:hypothetical protein